MPLTAPELATLSRLLDEALDLDARDRDAWLAALPEAERRLEPTLRRMLAERDKPRAGAFLASLPAVGATAPDESVARAGDEVGPYRLIREIGHGGMGAVWLAERADGSFKRQVALKLPRLAWGAGLGERMARERDIGAMLEHPAIARLYDAGVDTRGRPYLALEYIDGVAIDQWCQQQALPVRERLRLIVQVARAVAYAHGRLVVHRDLKPSNVMVSADGQVHLLDFGIARLLESANAGQPGLTQEHGRALTPHYASPEQLRGEAVTVQSDVYSLGVLAFELLTGSLPHAPKRQTLGALEQAVLEGEAPPPSSRTLDKGLARQLQGDIDAIIGKALKLEPDQRYATAAALVEDIERHLSGDPVSAQPDSALYRWRKLGRRHWVGLSATTAVLVAVLAGAGVSLVQAQRAARAADRERIVKAFAADVFRVKARTSDLQAAPGTDLSLHALLDQGAQLIEQRFQGQPDLQAELYGVVSGVFSDMGAFQQAAEYATRQVDVLLQLGADPLEQARALLVLARARVDDRQWQAAEPHVRRALELARSDPVLETRALVLQGGILTELRKFTEAAKVLDEVEARMSTPEIRASETRAWLLAYRARLLSLENRFDQALPLYLEALEAAKASEGPLSPAAISIGLALAQRLLSTAYADQAQQYFEPAVAALRTLGGAHMARAALATAEYAYQRKASFGKGSYSEAFETLKRSRDELRSLQISVPAWFVPMIDYWTGYLSIRQGHIALGLPLLESAYGALNAMPGGGGGDRDRREWQLGLALMDAGRHDEAHRLLARFADPGYYAGRKPHPFEVFHFVYAALNLSMIGRHREAFEILDRAPRPEPIRGEGSKDPNRYANLMEWTRARILMDQGDFATALKLLGSIVPPRDDLTTDFVLFQMDRGEARCALGARLQGLDDLESYLSFAESSDQYPHVPDLVRLRGITGLCALRAGLRRQAVIQARLARESLTQQPGVSPYYQAPVIELETLLAKR